MVVHVGEVGGAETQLDLAGSVRIRGVRYTARM
jgi:hypothetical protein